MILTCKLGRLVPFVLAIVIGEKIIPLVVLYASRLLPSTCVPSQHERILLERHEKRRQAYTFARLADILKGIE